MALSIVGKTERAGDIDGAAVKHLAAIDDGGAEAEDERRRAVVEKGLNLGRQAGLPAEREKGFGPTSAHALPAPRGHQDRERFHRIARRPQPRAALGYSVPW